MNSFIKTVSVFIIIIIFFTGKIYAQNCKSKINIKTDIKSSMIYVNHKLIGYGEAELEVEKGMYDISIFESKNEWAGNSIQDSIDITDCGITKQMNYTFNNKIYLDTSPQDVEVYSADSLLGFTPMFVPHNFYSLQLKKTDYENRTITLADITKNNPVTLKFIGKEKEEHFYDKTIFKLLIGGIVAFGITTVYFKLKADNAFDDYKSSNDQAFLDKTHKYDTLSGISMGILQVNFGFLIYYFLTD